MNTVYATSAIVITALSIFCASPVFSETATVHDGVIVVKLLDNSPITERWLAAERSHALAELEPFIGAHTTEGYLSDATLQAVERRLARDLFKTSWSSSTNKLARIAIVRFAATIDVRAAARTISGLPFVEYAEPLPRRRLLEFTQDPRAGEQWHLTTMNVCEALESIPNGASAVIAIIDSGVDYLHIDLADNIYNNELEIPLNGIDDDNNGFIDDTRGWDFVSANGGGDRDPNAPTFAHGTQVAGTAAAVANNNIGVASVAPMAKIMPLKVVADDLDDDVFRGHEAIAYAAAMGADVINCSWGGPDFSLAEREVAIAARAMGSVLIASAGNAGRDMPFYPAGYPEVISVANVNAFDSKASNSNYHVTVDISAPGVEILTTGLFDDFNFNGGTSFAAPCVAGVAALVKMRFPEFDALQITEQVKATAHNIDNNNTEFINKLGEGRADAASAVAALGRSIALEDYTIFDENGNGVLESGERIEIALKVRNALAAINSGAVEAVALSSPALAFTPEFIDLGQMAQGERRDLDATRFSAVIPDDLSENLVAFLILQYHDENGPLGKDIIRLELNQTFATLTANNLNMTFNNAGTLAFGDYPDNLKGSGFRYLAGDNMIDHGGLIIANSETQLSDGVYDNFQERIDQKFLPMAPVSIDEPAAHAGEVGTAIFNDSPNPNGLNIDVTQRIYALDEPGLEDFLLFIYEITNRSGNDFTNLHAGLFLDWDIRDRTKNQIRYNSQEQYGWATSIGQNDAPLLGMQVVTDHQTNFYAITNNGSDGGININGGVGEDDFSAAEKWLALSSGETHTESLEQDVSAIIGAGPITLPAGESVKVGLSIASAFTEQDLSERLARAKQTATLFTDVNDGPEIPIANNALQIINLYPNPALGSVITLRYRALIPGNVVIAITDALGRIIYTTANHNAAGFHELRVPTIAMLPGAYALRISLGTATQTMPFVIVR